MAGMEKTSDTMEPLNVPYFCVKLKMKHNPPHFHADYNDKKILVDIQKGRVLKGAFPSKQLKYVLAWAEIHQNELMEDWELARQDLPLKKIAPLM